jgi:hypothetical protein
MSAVAVRLAEGSPPTPPRNDTAEATIDMPTRQAPLAVATPATRTPLTAEDSH